MTNSEIRMQQALAKLDRKQALENLESFDGDLDGDTMQALESLAEENPGAAAVITNAIKKTGKHPHGDQAHSCGSGVKQLKKASVTFKVTRTITKGNAHLVDGSGQPVPLPSPIFGCLENASNYTRVLAAFLPKDGSVAVKSYAPTADGQNLLITFKSTAAGAGDDVINETILISATNAVYNNLIRGLSSYKFDIIKPKLIIGDALRTDQFDQPINVFIGSMFTSANTDNISPNDYKQEILSDNTVRVLQDNICINPEKTLVPMTVPPTATANASSFYYTLTCPLANFGIA